MSYCVIWLTVDSMWAVILSMNVITPEPCKSSTAMTVRALTVIGLLDVWTTQEGHSSRLETKPSHLIVTWVLAWVMQDKENLKTKNIFDLCPELGFPWRDKAGADH